MDPLLGVYCLAVPGRINAGSGHNFDWRTYPLFQNEYRYPHIYCHEMLAICRTSLYLHLLLYLTVRLIGICNLKVMVKAIHWLFPNLAFMWLVEEAKKNMPVELDFLNEGHNAEKVASMLAHFPFLKVHTQLQYKYFYKAQFYKA